MVEVSQSLVNGLLVGGIYALLALGLTIIFGVMRVINFAHGEFMMIGGLVSHSLFEQIGLNPIESLALTIPLGFAIGIAVQETLLRPIMDESRTTSLLVTFGLALVLVGGAQAVWGNVFRSVRFFPGAWEVSGVAVPRMRLVAFLVAAAVTLLLYAYLKHARFGKAIRATSQHPAVARTCGIDVEHVRRIAFGLGGALATAAGTLLLPIAVLHPQIGTAYLLKAFAVIVLGGLGSFAGALVGGLLLGIAETMGTQFMSSSVGQGAAFAVLLATLLLKPSGLMGRHDQVRV